MENIFYLLVIVALLLLALVPAKIAEERGVAGSPLVWYLGGLLLWPLALLAALVTRPDPQIIEQRALERGEKKCPRCAEMVKKEARVCRFCGAQLALDRRDIRDIARR